MLPKDTSSVTPDDVCIDIALRQHHKDASRPYLKLKWLHRDPLHPDNVTTLTRVCSAFVRSPEFSGSI